MLMWILNLDFAASEIEVSALLPYKKFRAKPTKTTFRATLQRVVFKA